MRVSQKLEYACRAAIQLAKHHDGETPRRLDDIALQEHVPANFLVQILSDLKQANLVISRRGKNGGYLLSAAPSTITLSQVIEAVDPQIIEEPEVSEGASAQALHQIWRAATEAFNESLKTTTLDKLSQSDEEPMYFI